MSVRLPDPPLFQFRSVSSSERLISIDALRGFALIGILVVNTLFFAFPLITALSPPWADNGETAGSTGDWTSWWIINLFFQYKFMTIFSILFGVGAAIQWNRARLAGKNFDSFFLKRLVVLFGFGVIHALFFWYGDILAVYALCGVWLLLFCRLSNRALIPLVVGLLVFTALLSGGFTALDLEATNQAQDSSLIASESDAESQLGFDAIFTSNFNPKSEIWSTAELQAYQDGPYQDLFVFRAITWMMYIVITMLSNGWHIMAMFALGVLLYRSGFFEDGAAGERLRTLTIYVGLPIGLLIESACCLVQMLYMQEQPGHLIWIMMIHELSVPLVSMGYASIVINLVRSGTFQWLIHALSCTGRMALTNYLLETVVMTSVFYYYGFGLFGTVERIYLIPVALVTWTMLAFISVAWLGAYRQGPVEWLWRRLTYGSTVARG